MTGARAHSAHVLDGENGLMLAVTGSSVLLCTANGLGRLSGVCGGKAVASGLRMKRFWAGVSVVAFLNRVRGVAGVSYRRSARIFRYGGDSIGIFMVWRSVDFRSAGLWISPAAKWERSKRF